VQVARIMFAPRSVALPGPIQVEAKVLRATASANATLVSCASVDYKQGNTIADLVHSLLDRARNPMFMKTIHDRPHVRMHAPLSHDPRIKLIEIANGSFAKPIKLHSGTDVAARSDVGPARLGN
jgi:hypothetical protein